MQPASGIARHDFTQKISTKPGTDAFRPKNYPNQAFQGVLRVSFRVAAAATPISIVHDAPALSEQMRDTSMLDVGQAAGRVALDGGLGDRESILGVDKCRVVLGELALRVGKLDDAA